ncbi:MAG: polyprenol monophosphomannose synthase [Candidatus Omnitrophota bacterium]
MKTAIVIPTYNEAGNIKDLIEEIFKIEKDLEIIIVDDSSPDGTEDIVRNLANKINKIHLIVRSGKRSEGKSRIDGCRYALVKVAEIIIEMDAEFSHNPKYIPVFLSKIRESDIVIGSRCIPGGRETGRPRLRVLLSKLANFYIRKSYGIKNVFDCTSGYRCFRREVCDKIKLDSLKAEGPAVIPEILFKAGRLGFRISEFPVVYENRTKGVSKFTLNKITESLILPLILRFRGIF